jgi:fibronectin type 3 domain-containing protein
MKIRRSLRNVGKGGRACLAALAVAGSVSLSLAALSSSVASASTLNGVATLTSPATSEPLSSGASTTDFTVVLPAQSDCSGDTASDGYHVYSYLLSQGTAVTTDNFSTGSPSEGLGLIDADGYYGQANTAPTSGQVIDIPTDFEWAYLENIGETAAELDGGSSAVWNAGIACANASGVVTDFWNTQVTFTASGSDPNGFTWTAVPGTVPGAPTSPSAAGGNASATVSWTDPASNGGTTITQYDVYDSTSNPPSTSGTPNATVNGATATSAPVTGLTNGTEYYFVVTAVNAAGQSAASSPVVNATPSTVPGAPTSPSATAGDESATVSWTDPASNGGSTITQYDVYDSTSNPPSTSGTPNATVSGATATSAPVTGLTAGTEYYFVVTAVNANGQSVASSPVVNATAEPTVPGSPTSVTLTRSGKNLTVHWTDPASNGGSAITGYDVYVSTSNPPSTSGTPSATASGATATSATVKKLSKTDKYYVVVVAVNTNGKSAPSAVVGTQDKTTTTVSCTPATVAESHTTTCTATVKDATVPSTTPTGTVTWTSTGAGTFTGGPSCTLSSGSCSVGFVPSATGKKTITADFPASSQFLASSGKAKIKVTS